MMIRRAAVSDIARINDLLYQVHQVHSNGRPDIFRPGMKKYTDEELAVLLKDPLRPVFVYTDDGGIIQGYCFTEDQTVPDNGSGMVPMKSLYIDDLCVDEASRGKHIGTELYRYVEAYARDNGYYRITLNVWCLNPGAMAFYESLGMNRLKIMMENVL